MAKITKDMIINEVLKMDRNTAMIFMKHGLHCLGWGGAAFESIGDAAAVHGINVDALINDLNEYFEKKGE